MKDTSSVPVAMTGTTTFHSAMGGTSNLNGDDMLRRLITTIEENQDGSFTVDTVEHYGIKANIARNIIPKEMADSNDLDALVVDVVHDQFKALYKIKEPI